MSANKHDVESEGAKPRDHAHPRHHFWKHAHRDWRVWIAVVLMLACDPCLCDDGQPVPQTRQTRDSADPRGKCALERLVRFNLRKQLCLLDLLEPDVEARNNGASSPKANGPLSPELLRKINAYWRAANYLSVGQIYLYDNPLLKEPLKLSHVKPLVVGHWGTTPGQNFIYVHLNRVIKKYDLDMFYVAGPGHGGPAIVGNVYLEGTWSEIYPNVTQDEAGLKKLFKQFSFPGGISSHVAPTTPGSIHEGGELGYSLSHAFGAAFDNPDLIVACVVGDGEAETGPLATAWQSNKFLDPISDGAVLPILHLNGFKISNPTVLSRIEHEELEQFLRGCGWTPYFVEGDDPATMHQLMAATLEKAIEDIREIQNNARTRTTPLARAGP